MVLNLPSPPQQDVSRDTAGGFGTAKSTPFRNNYGHTGKLCLNPFIPYAASVLDSAGYEYFVIDGQALKLTLPQVLNIVRKRNPSVIVSMISLPSMYHDIRLLREIKRVKPDTCVITVGTVCKVMPEEVLSEGHIDVVVRTEFPYVSNLIDLICTIQGKKDLKKIPGVSYVKDEKVINTLPRLGGTSMTELPSPFYNSFRLDQYDAVFMDASRKEWKYIPILGSKGCPHNCFYCPYVIGFGERCSYKPPNEIVNEMQFLHEYRGIQGFLFRDQSFTMDKRHAQKVCDGIIRRKLDVAWFCEARVDEVSRGLLVKMKKAGCKEIHYGVETGCPDMLKIGKPGVTLETIEKAFSISKEIGLRTIAHIILGLPGENKETLERTCKFLIDLNPDDVNWNFATPYPGTALYKIAQRNNWIVTYDWTKYTSRKAVMRTEHLNTSELHEAAIKMSYRFKKSKIKRLLIESCKNKHHFKRLVRLVMFHLRPTVLLETLSMWWNKKDQ